MSAVGFIGTGAIGSPMALRLVESGQDLVVFDLMPSATDGLVAAGAARAASIAEVAERCRVVFTSLPGPAELARAVNDDGGLLSAARPGDVHIDLSTISPTSAVEISTAEARAGVTFIDAPVSGGVAAARAGTLTVLASGPPAALEAVRPLLEAFAKRVIDLGEEPGHGSIAKLVNNAVFLAGSLAFQEGLVMAARAGLDPEQLYDALRSCSARPYLAVAPLVLARTFDDPSFKVGLAAKDLDLAMAVAGDLDVETPVFEAATSTYGAAAGTDANLAFFSTLLALESRAGISIPPVTVGDQR